MSSAPPGYDETKRDKPRGFAAEGDIFDTWFTSSLTPQIAAGWERDPEMYARLFPMDIRPQSHEIIRTWAFYTIVKAYLHQGTIPWKHVGISGWVLDPDRKKMSKSRGNVVTPMNLLDEYGADAIRYWSANARLGTDTAFDTNVMKVGKRLVTKLFNAGKFVLSQTASEGGISHPLDRSFLAELGKVAGRATDAMKRFDHAGALDETERFFWRGLTDNYLELVKVRSRTEDDPGGRASAVATLRLALSVFLRLFAPFLPYIAEEVWSWAFAEETGQPSIHRAPWPQASELLADAAGADGSLFETASACLAVINRRKSESNVSVGRAVTSLRLAGNEPAVAQLQLVLADVLGAARASDCALEVRNTLDNGAFEVLEAEFATDQP
jgi:valyl-tRNA synthetase